jgi:hypothetical protein
LFVNSTKAATSLPRKFSPSPSPITSGELRRAPTTTPGRSWCITSSVKAPSSRETTRCIARVRSPVSRNTSPTMMAATSVSVSLVNSAPASRSSCFSSEKFSMMPLWMRASLPSSPRCGWALSSVGPPWVAHRVWPMPVCPSARGSSPRSSERMPSLPARLRVPISPASVSTAMPAES